MSSAALQLASEALASARSRRSEDLEDLVEELRIPSVSTLPEHRSDCLRNAHWLRERCERIGADARVVDVLEYGLPVVIADWDVAPDSPHLTIYGHYDVQPVDPIAEWITAPFEPSQRDGGLYARGAADNKGPHLSALKALEHLAGTVGIPLNVRVIIEGEEEVNGESLPHYLRSHGHEMRTDAVLLWDSVMQPDGRPSLSTTVRGILYTELHATAATVDLHSGLYGGVAPNPINTLARIIGELKDRAGHVTIPGFYDAVREPSSREVALWQATDAEYAAALREMSGARALEGEPDYTVWERIGSRPSLDANGIIGGFTGKGKKTVIPAAARAKVSMRLVPNQDWRTILAAFERRVDELSASGVEVNVEVLGAGAPVTCDVDVPSGEALRGAFRDTIGRETSTVSSAVLCDDTIVRLGGDGGSGFLTWTSDDRQLATLLDGSSWPRDRGPFWHSRLFALRGRPEATQAEEVGTYPEMPIYPDLYSNITPPYYGFALLAVGDTVHQFLSTSTVKPFDANVRVVPDYHLNAAKLIYSPDNGRTWHNQDGSCPVVRERVGQQTRERLVFLDETNSAFSLLSFLQMGRAYRENQDGFAYVYSPNGHVDGRMNELVMFRVPTPRILDRGSYEFFAGRSKSGEPGWTREIEGRVAVQVFPEGRMHDEFNISWLPTVAFVAALGRYLMIASSAPGDVGIKPEDIGPACLGMWVSECPWGPWTQVFEDEDWTPGADPGARASAPSIAPAWIAEDGSSLWFIWMDTQRAGGVHGEDELLATMRTTNMSVAVPARRKWGRHHPGYCVNAQRIDLTVS